MVRRTDQLQRRVSNFSGWTASGLDPPRGTSIHPPIWSIQVVEELLMLDKPRHLIPVQSCRWRPLRQLDVSCPRDAMRGLCGSDETLFKLIRGPDLRRWSSRVQVFGCITRCKGREENPDQGPRTTHAIASDSLQSCTVASHTKRPSRTGARGTDDIPPAGTLAKRKGTAAPPSLPSADLRPDRRGRQASRRPRRGPASGAGGVSNPMSRLLLLSCFFELIKKHYTYFGPRGYFC